VTVVRGLSGILHPQRNPARDPTLWAYLLDALAPVAFYPLDLKALGERITGRGQTAEIQICIALMNRSSALGAAEIPRVA